LAGYHESVDSGQVVVRGVTYDLPLRGDTAKKADIRFVHQDLGLVDQMSITDNVCLYAGYMKSKRFMIKQQPSEEMTQNLLIDLGISIPSTTVVGNLGPTEKVMVAVARATVAHEHRGVLILDEPTAAVPFADAARILHVVRQLRDSGWAILYISHHLDEVLGLADRITVLRDGATVASNVTTEMDVGTLTRAIIGDVKLTSSLDESSNHELKVSDSSASADSIELRGVYGRRLRDVNIRFDAGTVTGVTGPTGSGKSELGRILSGAERIKSGEILINGQVVQFHSPLDALAQGIGYVPQDRIRSGLLSKATVRENLSGLKTRRFAGRFWNIRRGLEAANAKSGIEEFGIVPTNTEIQISSLSGGNQQKAVLARASQASSTGLILDDPTSGVDVGARAQIQEIIRRLAKTDVAVAILSSDLDELLSLCDRIIVLRRGEVSTILHSPVSREELAQATFGGQE
jgi:ribose transport system ATP-binding protein